MLDYISSKELSDEFTGVSDCQYRIRATLTIKALVDKLAEFSETTWEYELDNLRVTKFICGRCDFFIENAGKDAKVYTCTNINPNRLVNYNDEACDDFYCPEGGISAFTGSNK